MPTANAERMRMLRQNDVYRERERLAIEVARLRQQLQNATKWLFLEGFHAARTGRAFNARASAEWRDGFWTGHRAVERAAGVAVVSPRLSAVAADRINAGRGTSGVRSRSGAGRVRD